MKKLFLLLASVAFMGQIMASNLETQTLNANTTGGNRPLITSSIFDDGGQHIEFRDYGIYGVVDLTFMMNLAPQHDACDLTGFEGYNDAYSLLGFTASAGFQWRKESSVGIGFSFLSDPNGSFSQIPIFMEFRSHYTRNRLSPFSSIQMGYSIPFGSTNGGGDYVKITKGGMTFGVEGGVRFAFFRNFGMNVSVGYQLIQCREVERGINGDPATRLPELYHNLKASLGFNF